MKRYIATLLALGISFAGISGSSFAQSDSEGDTIETCITLTTRLSYGSSDSAIGGQVSALQEFLIEKGLLTTASGRPTGFYGRLTAFAVKNYQASIGVATTGSVGPLTRAAIAKETCGTVSSGQPAVSSPTTSQNIRVDETWKYGFYVVNSENDVDGDGVKEGCNEGTLTDPENFCVLKIGSMYVSPVNFTLKGKVNNDQVMMSDFARGAYYVPNISISLSPAKDIRATLEKNGLSVIDDSVFRSSSSACHQALVDLENRYKDASGRITNTAAYYAEWDKIRNTGAECVAYDKNSVSYYNTVVGKNVLDSLSSCGMFITSYKEANGNSGVSTSTIGNKKWTTLLELGGDGLNNVCSASGSNKKGLCALELNQSKLQLMSDGLYYGFKELPPAGDPFSSGMFVSLGDNVRAKATPLYRQVISQEWNPTTRMVESVSKDDTGVITGYTLTIAGHQFTPGTMTTNLYARCVGY